MGSEARRQRAKTELRAKILEAARELFVAHGYEAVTMRAIAEKIEYSPTAIYLHFKDKEALCHALCDREFLAFGAMFAELLDLSDPVERLRRAGQAYIAFGLRHPNHYRWMFLMPHPEATPEQSEIVQGDPRQDAYAFVRQTVAEGIAQQRFGPQHTDIDHLAQLVWAGVHGVVALHLTQRDLGMRGWIDWTDPNRLAAGMVDAMIAHLTRPE